jgi:methylglutaconyl-CoA hydratase
VHYVVSCGALESSVQEYALQVSKNSPSAIALTKSLLAAQHGMSLESGLEYAASMNALARGTKDTKKGIAKFLKR